MQRIVDKRESATIVTAVGRRFDRVYWIRKQGGAVLEFSSVHGGACTFGAGDGWASRKR